ncbi:hypothetical protein N7508_000992 [Penicillium antarcticum]|uniref:uncharacterized protein n=1 Tax=Penicillium antarcticum TaxID=416450 RepID=UPI00238B5ED5|nr:uncharacterized protein N7508_000992 [Penicillium antarcticum]KAJ5320709.1 hypothetical protein N7508_000992 [Penicillium antarcticum]
MEVGGPGEHRCGGWDLPAMKSAPNATTFSTGEETNLVPFPRATLPPLPPLWVVQSPNAAPGHFANSPGRANWRPSPPSRPGPSLGRDDTPGRSCPGARGTGHLPADGGLLKDHGGYVRAHSAWPPPYGPTRESLPLPQPTRQFPMPAEQTSPPASPGPSSPVRLYTDSPTLLG